MKDISSLTVCPPSTFWGRPQTPLHWLSWRQSVQLDTTWTGRTCTWLPLWLRLHKRHSQNKQIETWDGQVKCGPITSAYGGAGSKLKETKLDAKQLAKLSGHILLDSLLDSLFTILVKAGIKINEKREVCIKHTSLWLKRSKNMKWKYEKHTHGRCLAAAIWLEK